MHTHASYSYCDEADTFKTASYMPDMKQPGDLPSPAAPAARAMCSSAFNAAGACRFSAALTCFLHHTYTPTPAACRASGRLAPVVVRE